LSYFVILNIFPLYIYPTTALRAHEHQIVPLLDKMLLYVYVSVLRQGPSTTLWTHAIAIQVSIRQHAGACDVRAITQAHEVVKMIGKPSTCKIETEVNASIVDAIRNFHDELKERHQGRYQKLVQEAWFTMNTILGSVKSVPMCKVAQHIGVNVDHLYKGKGNYKTKLEDGDAN
jgi:hypothetical protein